MTSARPPTSGHDSISLDVGPEQVGARELEPGLRRHARRRLHDEPHGQAATRLDRVAHTVDARDVGELVRIDEHRGGAARAHRLGVRAGREHRRLEVHVHVDEAGRDEAAGAVERVEGVGARAGLVHARDERTDDADVGGAQLAAPDVDERAAGEQQVERLAALRGRDGAVRERGVDGIDRHQAVSCLASGLGSAGSDEVGEDAAQLDARAVGAHVHLGGDVERQPRGRRTAPAAAGPRRGSCCSNAPASASWSVVVEVVAVQRPCRSGSARRPPAARRSRARWCRRPRT